MVSPGRRAVADLAECGAALALVPDGDPPVMSDPDGGTDCAQAGAAASIVVTDSTATGRANESFMAGVSIAVAAGGCQAARTG